MSKQPGHLLVSKQRGILEVIPDWVRSNLVYRRHEQKQPLEVDVDNPFETDQVSSNVEQTQTNERKKVDEFLDGLEGGLPLVVTDQVLTEFGPATRTRTFSNSVLTADTGYKVLSSQVQNLGSGFYSKETIEVLDYPVLIEEKSHPDYPGARIRVTKEIISAPSNPQVSYNPTAHTLTEYEPIDSRRSVIITSQLMELPSSRTSYAVGVHSFPDELLGINVINRNVIEVQDTSTTDPLAIARYGVYLTYNMREGYSGPVKLKITEEWVWDKVEESDLPAVTQWAPQGHKIFIFGNDYDPYYLGGREEYIPPCLHEEISLGSGPGGIPSTIPATTPEALPHGQWVVKHADSQHWLLGAWKVTTVEMYVP
jgi:hypothetical protein